MKRILFIYLQSSSFVREDLDILGGKAELRTFRFGADAKPSPFKLAAAFSRQLAWLVREIRSCDAVYGWFADYHMVLPLLIARLFGKPVIVAVGGFDAIALPSLGYGVFLSSWRAPLARLVLSQADVLLPVSPSLVRSTNSFSEWPSTVDQGIDVFAPNSRAEIRVTPTGYDPERWPAGPAVRARVVSTVGLIDSDRTLRRKGIDLFFEAAHLMPEEEFRVVGVPDPEDVRSSYNVSQNVRLIPPVDRDDLVAHYHETSVYVQLSRAEGLPNVLCEAMMCGCVPVGSRVFGIPDGIGEAGFVVDMPDPHEVVAAIRRALEAPPSMREAARRHISERFSREQRRKALHSLVDELTTRSSIERGTA